MFALGHQLHQLPPDAGEKVRSQARSAIAFWTCRVIHGLNEDITHEKTRASDSTITAVLMLMLAEVSDPFSHGVLRLLCLCTLMIGRSTRC